MATASNVNLTLLRNVANANATVTYTVNWSAFDQASNLQYVESVRFIGDDTGQDGDTGPVGDDPISIGLNFSTLLSANGQATTSRTRSFTFPWANLNEDDVPILGNTDDEIRAVVTLMPQLPVTVTTESNLVTV
ncbi:hypothetical protein [Nakamurella multipartita]|jgi:hypothetical protein|uniref:Uncharacterized protein n=1 Tax=Nakamurella multipartita (strain ATCC 700099 / DSM 44233 / CIP 104796 / JCM 9543 / NBRC 105858 / Y-104) TaxID=479431 RepID=C8XJ28_NAKMY|nr:hypothetical protein [Nakamurella multipartita]ACV76615.1 hypothetical protein Namu_0182 [Nakamurella multipartita DSM 44233]